MDETHDPGLSSWVESANGHGEFPVQNLPLGIVRVDGRAQGAVAIGDEVLLLRAAAGVLRGEARRVCEVAAHATLNEFFALGSAALVVLRRALVELLREGAVQRRELLRAGKECEPLLPVTVGDYTDFYAGIVHAENVGRMFRPENPLLPNYKWVPIGYHGRASSVRVSGDDVRRPWGQRRGDACPEFAPTERMDFELEMGVWVGRGNALGERIAIADAGESIAGYCLLNDWSARDVQAWEYQPLGPFLGKNFHTTVSPWVVTPEALAPFRRAQGEREPRPLEYLWSDEDQRAGALGVELEVWLTTARMREMGAKALRLTRTEAMELFWTPAQMVAHHASNGCNLRAGDLLGTGTISSREEDGVGSLLERTRNGAERLMLPSGETRAFLEDGDEVVLRGYARRDGFVGIGFGECRGRVVSAVGR